MAHGLQVRKTGSASDLKLKSNSLICFACGAPTGVEPGLRKFCSQQCRARFKSHAGNIPETYVCIKCGSEVSCIGKSGRRVPKHASMCPRCRSDRRFVMNSGEVAKRDGTACALCGRVVNMKLRSPDPLCASVDHIIPRSKGGSDDPSNLQLAHLLCNIRKGNRL